MNINTNNPGSVAAAVWANATRVLTVGGAAVIGATLQAPASTASIVITGTGTTNIINYSGTGGVFMTVGGWVVNALAGAGFAAQIEIVIDGVTSTIPVWGSNGGWVVPMQLVANFMQGSGGSVGDKFNFLLPIQFNNSLVVRINITGAGTSGNIQLGAMYAHV